MQMRNYLLFPCMIIAGSDRLSRGDAETRSRMPVKLSEKAEEMLRFDLDNWIVEHDQGISSTRVGSGRAGGALRGWPSRFRNIIAQEQEQQHDLATALGIDVPNILTRGVKGGRVDFDFQACRAGEWSGKSKGHHQRAWAHIRDGTPVIRTLR